MITGSDGSASSCSEEDVLLPDQQNNINDINEFDTASVTFDDDKHTITDTKQTKQEKVMCTTVAAAAGTAAVKMDTTTESEDYQPQDEDMCIDDRMISVDTKVSKHNEDAANNNGSDSGNGAAAATDTDEKLDQQAFPPGYFSLEALQKMAQFVSAAMANNSDNEDAQKQLAVLQSTLFTLQHQQLFQLQLIQQLQSQLSINRSEKDDDEEDEEEDEREEGELTEAQMAEEKRKYEEEQRQLRKEEEDRLRALKKEDGYQPLNPNGASAPSTTDPIAAMESSFSSAFASTIITNHDQPSSMDGLNSLEMLQKRAEEVLDSASRGILSGSLTDEMSFKNDGKGRNEPFFKHRCRYCGKVFGSDSALQIHIRSHTGERPFKCNVCGSRFTTKGNLKVHFQRHTQKFPHIHMNPNPIPEHLDKFYPPLLPPLPPGQQPPLSPPLPPTSQSIPPHSASSATSRQPSQQSQMALPFPPIPGLPPGLQAFQGIPGLPMFRPPFDLLKQMGAHPFFGAMRDAVHQQEQREQLQQINEQDSPADLSKPSPAAVATIPVAPVLQQKSPSPVVILRNSPPAKESPAITTSPPLTTTNTIIKEEPKEESVSPQPPPMRTLHENEQQKSIEQKQVEELIEKHNNSSPVIPTENWKEDNKKNNCISPTTKQSTDDYIINQMKEQPENLSKISVGKQQLSPASSVGSRENHYQDHLHHHHQHHHHQHHHQALQQHHHNEMKIFPSMLPRPGSTDNSWESYIEVDKSSETTKLQQLVDNIENKITDPNECVVCHKVLSCRSALQMHYRTHTGERPFRCKICGRAFTTKGNLKTHMSVHRMKPPMRTIHQCPVCHKKYSNSLVLQQHIRLHTGEPIDLTLEQIAAAEIRDFPSLSPGSFPMGLNPFAFQIPGLHSAMGGPESSNGDNDDFMDEDFDDGSNFDENMSQADSISGDSNQNISNLSIRAGTDELISSRALSAMLAASSEHSKSVENLSRAASTTSHNESVEEKCSSPRTPVAASPTPSSDISQGALDLTPRSEPKLSPPINAMHRSQSPHHQPQVISPVSSGGGSVGGGGSSSITNSGLGTFPNFPFMSHVNTTSSPMSMSSTLNSLAQSVAPMGPFNPMALAGM